MKVEAFEKKSLKSALKKKKSFLAFPPNLYTAGSSKAPLNINLLKSFSDHFKPGEYVTFPCMIGSEVMQCNEIVSAKSSTHIWFSYSECRVTSPQESEQTSFYPSKGTEEMLEKWFCLCLDWQTNGNIGVTYSREDEREVPFRNMGDACNCMTEKPSLACVVTHETTWMEFLDQLSSVSTRRFPQLMLD